MFTGATAFIPIVCLLLGLVSGFVMHRSDYCFAGMFRDLFLFRAVFKLRTLLLLVVTSMLLFEVARQLGLLPIYPFPKLGSPSLAALIGGFLFGVGMVLAGGCVAGSLYKMGAGYLPSAVACAGLVLGSALYAEIHPWWRALASETTFFRGSTTVPQILGMAPLLPVLAFALVSSPYLLSWCRRGLLVRPSYTEGSLQPWKAALLLSLVNLTSYILIGTPMSISTSYSKIASLLESFFAGAHVRGVEYFQVQTLVYRQPLTGMTLVGGPGPLLDAVAAIQYPLIAGMVFGSAFSAMRLKEFKLSAKAPLRQYLSAAVGGIVMGLASRMTPSCNVLHLMGGLPILAAESVLFMVGLFPGAWLGSEYLSRVVIK